MDTGHLKKANEDRLKADLLLAQAADSGDRGARRRLADKLLDRVSFTVRCLAVSDPDRDDLTQMTFVEIFKSLRSYRGDSTLESWAERITVRTSMRYLKRRRWRAGILEYDSEKESSAVSTCDDPHQLAHRRRMAGRIAVLLDGLTPERRLVLTMRLVLGCSIEEISETTGMKVNTVRDRLAVARRQLRKKIMRDPVLRDLRDPAAAEGA